MHSLGFPLLLFYVAIMAELVLTESDQANAAGLVPLTPPNNSPVPIPITPDFDFNSYDSGSMFPVDMNPVASTPTGVLSLDSKIAQEPSSDNTESSIEPAINDANKFDSDYSLSSCNSVSKTSSRKLRRDQAKQCVPREPPGPPESPDTTQTQNPPGELTDGQMRRIFQKDISEMQRLQIRPDDPYWQTPEVNPCGRRNLDRPRSLCCLGPAYPRTASQKRDLASVVDVDNCLVYILIRPFCKSALGTRGHFCCHDLDLGRRTFRGYTGRDCVPMWINGRFDGLDPLGIEN